MTQPAEGPGPAAGADPDGAFRAAGEAVLFGFAPQPVAATIRPRTRTWRMTGAARTMGIALLVAPAVAVLPPHAPWLIGALAAGVVLARRRWMERFTLLDVRGACPKCGAALEVRTGRLRDPHPLACEGCHQTSTLRLPDGALDAATA